MDWRVAAVREAFAGGGEPEPNAPVNLCASTPYTFVVGLPRPTRRQIILIGAVCAAFAVASLGVLAGFAVALSAIVR